MKSAKVLLPVLMLVLVFCMLALTFAWFSASTETRSSAVLQAGTYIKVVFDDESGALVNEKYNGQKGYDENGVPYTDDDRAYQAYYHTKMLLQGDRDLSLRFEFTSLLIEVSDTFYMLSAGKTIDSIISLFDGYDPQKSHIGKVETVENGGEVNEIFTEPEDGSTAFIYTTDGTLNGKVRYIKLDKVNLDKFFTLEYAKITTETPPYAYGTFAKEGSGLHYTYGPNLPSGQSEVVSDYIYGKANPICIRITYSDEGYARTFPFSNDNFKASGFKFEIVAAADYV